MYDVRFSPRADRQLSRLKQRIPREITGRIVKALRTLEIEPKPARSVKVRTRDNCYRIRVGDYRIVYEVKNKESIVLILKINRRSESTYDF